MAQSHELAKRKDRLSLEKRVLLEKWTRGVAVKEGIPQRPAGTRIPLSFTQQQMWLSSQINPISPQYNIPRAFHIDGTLHVEALERALFEIIARHEMLRTRFIVEGEKTYQHVVDMNEQPVPSVSIDLSSLPEEERKAQLQHLLYVEAGIPFDLEMGPLLRILLLHLQHEEHVLSLTMHHIIADEWSDGILYTELTELYSAFVSGKHSPLPPLPIQYADYAIWQHENMQGQTLEDELSYWKQHLADAPVLLALPSDRLRPTQQTFRGDTYTHVLPLVFTERINVLCQKEKVTPFIFLLASFYVLLFRYSGQEDILIGAPIANRSRPEVESLIGFFVNTLALRVRLSSLSCFRDVLKQVREVVFEAYRHQELPLEYITDALQLRRNHGLHSLLQVVFSWQSHNDRIPALSELSLEPVEIGRSAANFDLALLLNDDPDGIVAFFQYSIDLFDKETIQRMGHHFQIVLENICANFDLPLADVAFISPAERQHLLFGWNATEHAYPCEQSLQEIFQAQVEHTPEAVALVFAEGVLTYQALNQRANQLAHYLQTLGVGVETPVALCLQRSPEIIITLLGILKAGGAYVPLDPDTPWERLAFIVDDIQVDIVVTTHTLQDRFPEHDGHLLFLDSDWQLIAQEATADLVCNVTGEHLAYVMYTSGSTGRPKGVSITHRAIMRLVKETNYASFAPEETFIQFAPVSFDAATFEIWGSLLNGARLVIFPPATPSLEELGRVILHYGVTTLWLTAGLFHEMVDYQLHSLRDLHQLLAGGDVLSISHVRQILENIPTCHLINGYGPTENTTFTTCYTIQPDSPLENSVPIGYPIANTQVYILDQRLQPVPALIAGELYIAGVGLARDYFHVPDLTAERFVPHPFSQEPGQRMYKTGDLVRYRSDGTIEFLGRIDQQVKVRGYRIELGEIEAALHQHPAIQEAVVLAREDRPGDKMLVAYVRVIQSKLPAISELRTFLGQVVPVYMLPSAWVLLEAFPLNSNGKVDRHALPAPERSNYVQEEQLTATRTPIEELLLGLWQQVLGIEQIGIYDSFFDLGGHSLRITQLLARVQTILKVQVSMQQFFQTPTIAGLAQAIVEVQLADLPVSMPPLLPVSRPESLPLSFAQQRLWFLEQLHPETAAYNIPIILQMHGRLNRNAFKRSLNEIVRRHEMLRTRFVLKNESPVQVIEDQVEIPIPVISLQTLSREQQDTQVQSLFIQEAHQSFDLQRGPLLRVELIVLGEQEQLLFVNMHHIISDGWSLGVFNRELGQLYTAFAQEQASPLPDLAVQYADFTLWQQAWLETEVIKEQLTYWREQLAGAPAMLEIPTDYVRPSVQTFRGTSLKHRIPSSLVQDLKSLSRQSGVTLFMTLLAAFAVLLERYSGQKDLVIGSPIANRVRSELEGLIGFFVNTLALRIDLSGEPSFLELLVRVRKVCLEGYINQDVPFEKLVDVLAPERQMSYSPLFQVMFVLQNAPVVDLELPDVNLDEVWGDNQTAKFDLTMSLVETSVGLSMVLEYNTDLFKEATVVRMAEHFHTLLEAVVLAPEQLITRLPLLSNGEREQLEDWNVTEMAVAQDRCIHHLFEKQTTLTPDAVALVFEEGHLTYQELDERANQLAHYLQKRGVGPEVLVGICLERCLETLVGMLGLLKVGATYVPLDPDYPIERLRFMIENAQLSFLLTQQRLEPLFPHVPHIQLISLDVHWENISWHSKQHYSGCIQSDNAAYIIYTSGSTGHPKGIIMPHRPLVNLIAWHYHSLGFTQPTRTLQFSSLNFDISVLEAFSCWHAGGTLVLIAKEMQYDGPYLLSFLFDSAIERTFLPFTALQLLADTFVAYGTELTNLHSILSTAEPLRITQSVYMFLKHLPDCTLFNQYGPSEAHVVTTLKLSPQPDEWSQLPPIGVPLGNVQIYILDRYLQPVPIGIPGELYIGGVSLARGYLHQPALTAVQFIPNPMSQKVGERLYKTGDLVRYHPDGNIEYLGRVDQQVKVRGYRVEIGEIEIAIQRHPAVQETVVLAREDRSGDTMLVAYLRPVQGEQPSASELRSFLSQILPKYMLPTAWVWLESFPLIPTGKVNRHALPAPERSNYVQEQQLVAPRTPLEELLLGLWQQVLGVERIGIYDSFFDLGGHSLRATQLLAHVRGVLQVEVPLQQLFQTPTIVGLAQAVIALQTKTWVLAPPLQAMARPERIPLSFAQQRLWFLEQLHPGTGAYNLPIILRLQGRLDRIALQRSLSEIVRRHEVLRTHFAVVEGQPVQVIVIEWETLLPVISLHLLSEAQQEEQLQRLLTAEVHRSFCLETGPVLYTHLVELAEQEHILLLNMHHIVSDGWSMGIFNDELSRLYDAIVHGQASTLPDLTVQYADFALWQRAYLQGEVLQEHLNYWREHLIGAPAVLELPMDHPRPAVQTFRGQGYVCTYPVALAQELNFLSRREGTTLFMTLLAAFSTLLMHYSGQDDLVIGTPIANRGQREIEGLIGFFVNTLALRIDLSGHLSFLELLTRVREVCLGAYMHQDLPFEKLVDELVPQRQMSHAPIFQIAFVVQNAPDVELHLPELTLDGVETTYDTAKFDLTMSAIEAPDGLTMVLEYNVDLFEKATIVQLAEHFQRLLEAIVQTPELPLTQFSLLRDMEQQQLLQTWSIMEPPADKNLVHQLFEEQAELAPDVVAVVFENQFLTYGELERRANQIAHYLQSSGIGVEVLVGLHLERSLELMIALLGILKAGGAYVPLDPSLPTERLAFIIEDAKIAFLLTLDRLREHLPQTLGTTYCCLDSQWIQINRWPATPVTSQVMPDHLAYVIYTSGSTGKPKGAMISHNNLVRLLSRTVHWFHFQADDVWTLFHSYAFDFSIWELWGALAYGGKLVIVPYWISRSPEDFYRLLVEEHVTVLNQTPSAFRSLMQFERRFSSIPLTTLRFIIFGGEALELRILLPWFERHGDQQPQLVNMYGITETTVHVTYRPLLQADVERKLGSRIGCPLPDLQCYVLNAQHHPVPPGLPGELYIGGAGLARGYLQRADLTAESFIPHPFSSLAGDRLYRTGDLVRYLASGEFEYLGRVDQQVKLHGFRIELGEIEVVLRRHPQVKDTLVLLRNDETTEEKHLVAYIVSSSQEAMSTVGELRSFLQVSLPAYMLPSLFVFIEAIPLTPNGKLDYNKLPAPNAQSYQREVYVAARSTVEHILVTVWENVLSIKPISVFDNYFALGGDSIRSIQLVHAIGTYGFRISPVDVFLHQTIADLATHIHMKEPDDAIPFDLLPTFTSSALFVQYGIEDMYPATQMQEMMLYHYEHDIENSVYHTQQIWSLQQKKLSVALIEGAINALLQAHPGLRTIFLRYEDKIFQAVQRHVNLAIPVIDVKHLSYKAQKNLLDEAILADKQNPFHALQTHSPLFRFKLFLITEDRVALFFSMHHAIEDGWSNVVLKNQLVDLYQLLERGREGHYVETRNTCKEFVALEQEILGDHSAQHFWRTYLSGVVPTTLMPEDTSAALGETLETYEFIFLNERLVENLQKQVIQQNVSLKALFVSTYLDLLRDVFSNQIPIVGVVSNGRSERMTNALTAVGLFWNIVPVIGRTHAEQWIERVKAIQEDLVHIEAYVRVPLPGIQRLVEQEQLFFATMNYIHFHHEKFDASEEKLQIEATYGYDKFHFPLNFIVSLDSLTGRIDLRVEYNQRYFDRTGIQNMIDIYREKLEK